jgi:hypothetical protein
VKDEHAKVRKEAVFTQYLFQGSEEKHKKIISEYAVPLPKFEPRASCIHAYDIASTLISLASAVIKKIKENRIFATFFCGGRKLLI